MAADKTSKSQEKRKSSKPLMEKRRRARINECLSKLQAILEVVNGHTETPGGHSKREKAEVLEQTVQLVKHLRHQEQGGNTRDSVPHSQYRAGFNECLNEVSRFMAANDRALNAETRSGLLNHLASTMRTPVPSSSGDGTGSSDWNTRQFVQSSPRKAALPEERVVGQGVPVVDRRGCTAVQPVNPLPPPAPVTPPQLTSVPSMSNPLPRNSSLKINTASSSPQQFLRQVEHQKAAVAIPAAVPSGLSLPITLQSPPAGHIAVVLPAHLLNSFVGGQLATGQLIPLYQQQGSAPVTTASSSVVTVSPRSSAMIGPTPGNDRDNNTGGRVFIAPNPVPGSSPNMASISARMETSSVMNPERRVPVSNPPVAPSGMETTVTPAINGTLQNGVIYAPASLPMQFYVAPCAYGGVNGPFTNGLALANPPSLALDAMGSPWRPWGLEQNQR